MSFSPSNSMNVRQQYVVTRKRTASWHFRKDITGSCLSCLIFYWTHTMVEYSLTPSGQTLTRPIEALRDWSEQYIEEVEQMPAIYDQKSKTPLQEEMQAFVQQRADAS